MNVFVRKKNVQNNLELEKPTKKSGRIKILFSKISGGIMLPVALLAASGIFLGIGAAIQTETTEPSAGYLFGGLIAAIGNTAFGILPVLFAISLALSFSEQAGVAGFASFVLWFGMNSISSVFLLPTFVETNVAGEITQIPAYSTFGWGSLWGRVLPSLLVENLGILSFNTSIFGAIVAGIMAAFLYNKFHETMLPTWLGFFSGQRLVPILALFTAVPFGLILLLIWPVLGAGLNGFGTSLGGLGYGTDALIFYFVERALIPFGLHVVFVTTLEWTSAGGFLDDANLANALWESSNQTLNGDHSSLSAIANNLDNPESWRDTASNLLNNLEKPKVQPPTGDQFTWFWLQSLGQKTFPVVNPETGVQESLGVFPWITKFYGQGVNPGRFSSGRYILMIFGLPAIGAAMIVAAPKENRKVASSVVVAAGLAAFLSGISEPLEFTFLFLAPWLFYGIYAPLVGVGGLLMTISGAHMSASFSTGIIDLVIYGILPFGLGTGFWWTFVYGPFFAALYFVIFYFIIKKKDLKTPGRAQAKKLFSKQDWKTRHLKTTLTEKEMLLIDGFGGIENISKFANCASRLRYDLVDGTKLDEDLLKAGGALGVFKLSAQHVQVVVGTQATTINQHISNYAAEANKEKAEVVQT